MWMFSRIKESRGAILIVLTIYVVLWIVIFPMISDCFIFGTDCSSNAGRSLYPLFGFLETGQFGMLSGGITYTYNPPGYAAVLWLLGVQPGMAHPFASVIPVQAALLFAIGLMVFAVVKEVWGRFAVTALVIAVFNPNALFVVAQPREDTFFAFFIAVAIAATVAFHRSAGWRAAAICGIALGLSANFRPTGHYLIYVLPVLFLVFALVTGRRDVAFAYLKKGAVGALLGWLLILPWMSHLYNAGESFSLTNFKGKFYWASDFRAMLADTENREMTWKDAIIGVQDDRSRKTELNTFLQRIDPGLSASNAGWADMTENQRYKYRFKEIMTYLDDFQARTYVIAALPNWRHTFASGGEGELFKALGLHQELSEWRKQNLTVFVAIKTFFMGYSITLKLLALLGIIFLFKARQLDLLVFFVGAILYFMAVHIYHGSPRYRLPLEPIFVFLAICGAQLIADRFGAKAADGLSQRSNT